MRKDKIEDAIQALVESIDFENHPVESLALKQIISYLQSLEDVIDD